jgi:predicted transcriptional regulator
MDDFVDKKEKIADLIEEYISDDQKAHELIKYCTDMCLDEDFKNKELFQSMLPEIVKYLPELSRKELKQRVSLIRTFME